MPRDPLHAQVVRRVTQSGLHFRAAATGLLLASVVWGVSSRLSAQAPGSFRYDAFRDEPLPPDSPFYDLDNVIITPHTSWSSGRVLDRSIELFCDNLRRFRTGEPLRNVVDPGVGY